MTRTQINYYYKNTTPPITKPNQTVKVKEKTGKCHNCLIESCKVTISRNFKVCTTLKW